MIQEGVLPLNVIAACFHLLLAAIALALLKKSSRPTPAIEHKEGKHNVKEDLKGVDFNRLIVISWLKKYTLIGGTFCKDQKFMTKEILIIAVFGISCLHINKLTLWPASLSLTVLIPCFILWEIISKKLNHHRKEQISVKPNIVHNQPESQMEIEAVIVEPAITIAKSEVKNKNNRSTFETISIAAVVFTCLVMQLQTVMTLSTSISNSGQLNIISVLAVIAIDQVAVRMPLGLIALLGIKLYLIASEGAMEETSLVTLMCSQEINVILIEKERERERKALEMAASPPRQKRQSPSRVPKAITQSVQRSTYLNLINLQPTIRQDEIVDEVVLTAAEKDLFQDEHILQQKNGFYTRRQRGREGKQYYSHSAQKGTTVDARDKKEFDDLLILKDDPFGEVENIGEFQFQDSGIRETRRKAPRKRRNKRNLQLTGNSPYLEYLPDMLKKVDKFKEAGNKESATKPIR